MIRRRPMLRTAILGGGAFMAGRAAANQAADRSQREAAQEARIRDLEDSQQQAQAPPVPEPRAGQAPASSDVFGQLTQLVEMHERGALTDEEFTAAKARLLS